MQKFYLTPDQVAERLQVNVETIYRHLRAGHLRGVRVSRKCWRIAEAEVDVFLRGL